MVQGVTSGTSPALAQPLSLPSLRAAWFQRVGIRVVEKGTPKMEGMLHGKGRSQGTKGAGAPMSPSPWPPNPVPNPLPALVAEKTKEQASHLGGAMFSGAGNIAAATGLMKKEEFPTDLKVSSPSTTHVDDYKCTHVPTNPPQAPCHPSQHLTSLLSRGVEMWCSCDYDSDLAVHMHPACKGDLDHFWPHLQVSLIVHSFLFLKYSIFY